MASHQKTTLTLGYSPCPNDTFIFDALIHNKIDTEGLTFEVVLGDVETLNQQAFRGELDITKLSYHAFGYVRHLYALLTAGSALGNNCGPLLIANPDFDINTLDTARIAIPGKYTTANFLLSLAYPHAQNKIEFVFSEIEDAILQKKVEAGLIIHENRFTYQQKGLQKLIDLGEYWESTTGLPIPLGGIVVRRDISTETQQRINRVLRRSVEFALQNPAQTLDYVSQHAQAMEHNIMLQHIQLYVNDYTVDLGDKGTKAIEYLFQTAHKLGIIPACDLPIFIEQA